MSRALLLLIDIQRDYLPDGRPYLKPGAAGFAHDARVAPAEGEPVVTKQAPNGVSPDRGRRRYGVCAAEKGSSRSDCARTGTIISSPPG